MVKLGRLDPRANNAGWQYEQRLVMAEKLGRPLRPDEEVRHRNGDPADNSPENLRLLRSGLEVSGDAPHCRSCDCELSVEGSSGSPSLPVSV